jgi:putative flippase GtrA
VSGAATPWTILAIVLPGAGSGIRFLPRTERGRRWGRFAAGSAVAAALSELFLLVTYAFGAPPAVAALIAFAAGFVPKYLLNRRWVWRRRGRADVRRELVPYVLIVVVTALVAIAVTTAADAWVRVAVADRGWQVVLVGTAYLTTYGFMFVLKFVLFDRLVFTATRSRTQVPSSTRPYRRP